MTTTETTPPVAKKVLVLHIEVPDVWADDLDEMAVECYSGDYADAILDSDGMGLDERVALMVVVRGDEDGPMTYGYTGRVVGGETRDRTVRPIEQVATEDHDLHA